MHFDSGLIGFLPTFSSLRVQLRKPIVLAHEARVKKHKSVVMGVLRRGTMPPEVTRGKRAPEPERVKIVWDQGPILRRPCPAIDSFLRIDLASVGDRMG